MNHHATHLGQRSFRSKLLFRNTHTHTADRMRHTITKWLLKAKFHYTLSGSKLVGDQLRSR